MSHVITISIGMGFCGNDSIREIAERHVKLCTLAPTLDSHIFLGGGGGS